MTNQLSPETLRIDMDEESRPKKAIKQRKHRLNPVLELLKQERRDNIIDQIDEDWERSIRNRE